MNVAVVGAGIVGASAAYELAARGHRTTLFEQFELGHDRGSSHGASRIVRRAYPDALYTAYMLRAYPFWERLAEASPMRILEECGLLYFGDRESAEMLSMIDGLEENAVPYEVLDPQDAARRMPRLRLSEREIGVFTPGAGWVHSAHAISSTLMLAQAAGAEIVVGRRVEAGELSSEFDAFVVAAGAWIRNFVPVPIEVTKQTFAYIEGSLEGPVWIEDSLDNAYGFPNEDDLGFKVGVHRGGPVIDPDDPERAPEPSSLEVIRDVVSRRFGEPNPVVKLAKGCLYAKTASEDFLLGRVGDSGFFASACSGHGFKFGPWIGSVLADFVESKDSPAAYPRFHWRP